MKRLFSALLAVVVSVAGFADEQDDRVLSEARSRAQKNTRTESDSTQPASADEAEEDSIYLPLALSILPGSPLPGKKVDATVGLGLIISGLNNVFGAQASFIGSVAEGSVNGFQGAYIFNVAEEGVNGAQLSYIFNVSGGTVFGGQAAGVFNVSKGGGPLQTAGVFNVAEGNFSGLQSAGVFNVAAGSMFGVQAAGIFNIAEGNLFGLQAAGIFNVAKDVKGLQIGLVNVAESSLGLQIGLINIVRNGINDMGVWFEDSGYAYGFLQKGTNRVYSILYLGAPRSDWFKTNENLAGGLGLGVRLGGDRTWDVALDVDLSAKMHWDAMEMQKAVEEKQRYQPMVFPSFRSSLRLPLALGFALHGGIVLDIENKDRLRVEEPFREADAFSNRFFETDWTFHPKLFLGLSF